MFLKVFLTLITFVIVFYVSGYQLQSTNDQFLSKNIILDNFVSQNLPYNHIYTEQNPKYNKRAYVRLAGKRALVRLGKRAYVRLGKKNYLLPFDS
ncbi:Hypothetical protein SRAE_X000178200 [Strongyloides ratti]|uniref:Uncharacterized protein n=1 Tax=Strongyloides ratti TaxID=34506 RepID=A0A090MPK1_STRRB|nr:Hypothetical protein SRAE_X000178200 [Strongyloides ratti]CEF60042.1 Hypothetical protein SRAE_X000178200 [Strongyloides ratti]